MSEEREGFLSRWSRKKRLEVDTQTPDVPVAQEQEPEFDISTLPDLDSLTESSNAMAFLQKGVPDSLKNAALRKIWSADTSIRDYIGPVEMGWDFNDPNGIPGFGPLSPDTDVAALLKQAIGEVEPALDAEKNEAAQVAIGDGAEVTSPLEKADSIVIIEDGSAKAISSPVREAQNQISDQDDQAESASFRAIRRHGGAMPS